MIVNKNKKSNSKNDFTQNALMLINVNILMGKNKRIRYSLKKNYCQ